nr:RNA polymerase, sigma-24 subunit, ECF subfamily [uncultured bacterium]
MDERDVAFDSICRELYPRLVGALGLYTGSRDVGEELAQEALARAWRKWKAFSTAHDPSAWVFVVAFNLAKSRGRRLQAERRALRRVAEGETARSERSLADEHDLRNALARIPHRFRTVLVARYYLGWTLQETADHLGVPLPTVKTWSARGIDRLRNDGFLNTMEAIDAG